MPIITGLTPQRLDPDRLNVMLDGVFAFGLRLEIVAQRGLRLGQELTDAEIADLQNQDRGQAALERALRFLSHRPRSEQETRQRLTQAGFESVHIEAAIERLKGWGYLADAEFARLWVENRQRHRPRGDRLLAQELHRKGIDRTVIDDTIASDETDDIETALRAGRRKAQQLAALEPRVFRQRLGAFLARRGFGWETIQTAVTKLRAELDAGIEPDTEA